MSVIDGLTVAIEEVRREFVALAARVQTLEGDVSRLGALVQDAQRSSAPTGPSAPASRPATTSTTAKTSPTKPTEPAGTKPNGKT